ncbi:MAG: xanthine dehydrogenase family protein molybdopterin-binding subunit [Ilumatobacteraceae bacterium]
MSILGNRVQRTEDPRLLTGAGRYVENVPLEGCLTLTFATSTVAHGRITALDTSAAAALPGVVGVFTADDLGLFDMPCLLPAGVVPGFPGANPAVTRPILARDRVRFVGDLVAAIVAEDRYVAADARDLVEIDYDVLPALIDMEAAVADEALLFDEAGTNMISEIVMEPATDPLAGADVVVAQRIVNQRIAAAPLETRAGAAVFDGTRLTFYGSTQGPAGLKGALAALLGLEPANVRVIAHDVGGGFGAKGLISPEELVVAALAIRLGRPVRWMESRQDSLVGMPHGRGQVQMLQLGATADGIVLGARLDVIQDCGAYPNVAPLLPTFTWLMMTGTYDIANVAYRSRTVLTNTTPVGAFRGAGRPEATFALERGMDLLAARLGLDPAEVRRRNLVAKDRFPLVTATGAVYDSGDYHGALDTALQAADYPAMRDAQARGREAGGPIAVGIGVSTYVEITNPIKSPEPTTVRMDVDGSVTVHTGTGPHGQGHETSWAMIAADRLGVPMTSVTVVYGDTDATPAAAGTGGSRSLQTAGAVVAIASEQVVDAARKHAADVLEAAVDDVEFDKDRGVFHVAGSPAVSAGWDRVMASVGEPLREDAVFEAGPSYPFGAHVAKVSIDIDTGYVHLDRLVAVDDCGTIMNPLLVDGQIHGGAAQGIAQALYEEIVYDEDGNPLTSTFADYLLPSAAELINYEVVEHETPSPNNALGAKGIGESGTIGSTPAVVSAVLDALAPFGIEHLDMPLSPQRIWHALQAAQTR